VKRTRSENVAQIQMPEEASYCKRLLKKLMKFMVL
jgi:hypothetical protein